MNKLILTAALLCAAFALGQARADDFSVCRTHLSFGTPITGVDHKVTPICHRGYAALVDDISKVPVWVAYDLTGPHTLGCADRQNNFHADSDLAVDRRARPADYSGTGYDLGHLAPAQDFAWDAEEMSDSFSLANIAPQLPGLNRQEWERLEEMVRAWAWSRGDLQIYVGPIMRPGAAAIGKDGVVVPAAFWKVIVDPKKHEALAFEMPQQDIPKGDLTPWLKTVADVEFDAEISLPMPVGIDKAEPPILWAANLIGWRKAHASACSK